MTRHAKFEDPNFDQPMLGNESSQAPSNTGNAGSSDLPSSDVARIIRSHEAQLFAIPGVKSIGEGRGPIGDPAIEIGIAHAGVTKLLPRSLDGVEVITHTVGEVDAYLRKK